MTATKLGIVLAALDRHGEAVSMLLYAATSWQRLSGEWAPDVLGWLKRERRLVGVDEFTEQVRTDVPAELAEELVAAIDAAEEPEQS